MTKYLDKDAVDELKAIMEDDIVMLFETYLEDSNEKLAELEKSILSSDHEAIRQIAHSLKGSSRNVGAVHLADIFNFLEDNARAEKFIEPQPAIEKIQSSFEATVQLIKQEFDIK